MKALILVDLQNDFVAPGALEVPQGAEVVAVANRLLPEFDVVVATQDWHPANHLSFASQHPDLTVGAEFDLDGLRQIAWPDHCVAGTSGAGLMPQLNRSRITRVFRKGTDRHIDSYSGFFDNGHRQATGLDAYLREQGVSEVAIMGLATDYCVRFTALDAQSLGYKTRVLLAGCRGVELHEGDIAAAIAEMRTAGIEIVP